MLKSYPDNSQVLGSVYSFGSLVLMFGLWIWVLFAFRRHAGEQLRRWRPRGQQSEPTVAKPIAHWSNIPQIKMRDAGGAARAKAEILADRAKPPHQTTKQL